jgi:Putative auto-transporter adhesin, head GIN domain
MKRRIAITACALALPGAALAATRTYETGAFEGVSVASGVDADVTLGPNRSVIAETKAENFDDLRISVEGNVLRIDRPAGGWFSSLFSGGRPDYKVHVVTPTLHSLVASSGAEVTAKGDLKGDFSVKASSGSDVDLAGSCISLVAEASSGSDLDAEDLKCENVTVRASSGSDVSVTATKRVTGSASSGSDVSIRGRPPVVEVEKSSGSDVKVRD